MGFLDDIGQTAATTAANGIIGTGMGLLLEKHNDARQINQQQKLSNMQLHANEELSNYNFDKQYDMWQKTSYAGQVEQLKKAGMNPALLYGGGGGGGTTTGSPSGGISVGQAPSGGHEIMDITQQGAQLALLNAQKELLESQTQKNTVEAANEAGVNKDLTVAQTASLTQGISNQKAVEALTQTQNRIAKLHEQITGETVQEQIATIGIQMELADNELQRSVRGNSIDAATMQDKIKTVHGQMLQVFVQNQLTEQQTKESQSRIGVNNSQIKLNEQQLQNLSNAIVQRYQEIELQGRSVSVQEKAQDLQNRLRDMTDMDKVSMETLNNIVSGIISIGTRSKGFSSTTIDEKGNESHTQTNYH
jgi:hypothetical protein